MINLMRRQLERNAVFLVVVAIALAAFELVICAVVASMDIESAFGQMIQFAPPAIRAMVEQNLMGGTPAGVLAFGWNHPVAHALLSAVAITLATRVVAGEIESGAIELVAAQPMSRAQYFSAHVLFGVGAIGVVLAVAVIATAVGQRIYALPSFGWRLAPLFLNMLLLQLAIYGLTVLASAYGREAGRVALTGVMLTVLSYLVNAVATLWSKAEFLKPWSLHSYFDPRQILVQDHLSAASVVLLASIALLATKVAFVHFRRRDLP